LEHLETEDFFSSTSLPAPLQQTSSRRLAHLIDRLSHRLGADHVVQPHLQADSQPERAYYNASWITHLPQQKHSQQTSCSTAQPLIAPGTRPLQLLSPPPRLAVTAIACDGPPVRFKYRQHYYHVEQAWGPERIETGWWRGPVIRRDYYRVQTMTGHRFWLFRELQHNDWYLHGHFS
jgi:protein ImuB